MEVEWEQEGYSRLVWFLSRVDLATMKDLSLAKKGEVPSDNQRPHPRKGKIKLSELKPLQIAM